MNISCEVIKDLLPLYNDKVCSTESGAIVEAHIKECSSCRELLESISEELTRPTNDLDDAKPIKAIQKVWKKDKIKSLIKGIAITTLVVAALAVCLYILYSPRPIITTPYSMVNNIERTYYDYGDGSSGYSTSFERVDDDFFFIERILYRGEDVTERFNPEEVAKLLSNTMSYRTTKRIGTVDKVWSIEITRKNGMIHILLGQTVPNSNDTLNYWYQSGTHYQIIDPTALAISLEQMMASAKE